MQNGGGSNSPQGEGGRSDRQNDGDRGGYRQQGGDRGGYRQQNGFDRPKFPATCSKCGKDTTVPFEPTSGRPVYCFECFKEVRGDRPPRRSFGGRREF